MTIPSVTDEWLEVYDRAVADGEDFKQSVWWRLAVDVLPNGVDKNDPRVVAAVADIRVRLAAD